MTRFIAIFLLLLNFFTASSAIAYDWNKSEPIPETGLDNPLNYSPEKLSEAKRAGRYHAINYPIDVTGVLAPYHPVKRILGENEDMSLNTFDANTQFLRTYIEKLFNKIIPYKSFDDFSEWLGLYKYPKTEGEGPYFIPFSRYSSEGPDKDRLASGDRIGISIIEREGAKGFTFACALCHSSQLFGKTILGLQNRFARANEVFVLGDRLVSALPSPLFRLGSGATEAETEMYKTSRRNMLFIESQVPLAYGMDTSLSHVALSLSHRKLDDIASKSTWNGRFPRKESLRTTRGDSKPGTWWNVKYKNRWLLDGSVVSGNPVFTNILWNEIGRGTDLVELENWLLTNPDIVNELTTAVYSAEAPHITDFFPAEQIDLESAKRGQKVFREIGCKKCHGDYIKNWEIDTAEVLSRSNLLKTAKVIYFEQTPVKNVGTDPLRRQAMSSLTQLNDLRISKIANAKIEVQEGYVPPPLVGIWARWPYFHNNSAASLCEVLTPEDKRLKEYWMGPANDRETDFDFKCNGYPTGSRVPKAWLENPEYYFNARITGKTNIGHSNRILVKDGNERLNPAEKADLIQFLQTL